MYLSIIIYSILTFFLLFLFSKISYKLKLIDNPNSRKTHSVSTAFTGGIAISISLIFSILLFNVSNNNLNLILSMALLICIVGLIDDKFDLHAGSKLCLQIIPIFYLIIFQNLELNNLGEYYFFKLNLGAFAIPFTLLCVLFLINAFNYFDGIDGTLSFTSISTLVILYFLISNSEVQLYLIILSIPIGIFLLFNFSFLNLPKMFLGDGGSLLLGFIISFILIFLANENLIHPILLAWSIVIFVYEFLTVNLIRIKNNKNPFDAGQDHLHYLLNKKTKSIFLTNFLITIFNFILFFVGYVSFILVNPLTSLIMYILVFFPFLILRNKL